MWSPRWKDGSLSTVDRREQGTRRSVRRTVFVGLAILIVAVLITAAYSVVEFYRYRGSLQELSAETIPSVIRNANLSAEANQLLYEAERLAAATSDPERRIAASLVQERLDRIRRATESIDEYRDRLTSALDVLDATLRELDELVARRIETVRRVDAARSGLHRFTAKVIALDSSAAAGASAAANSTDSGTYLLLEWSGRASRIMVAANEATGAETLRQVQEIETALRTDYTALSELTAGAAPSARAQLEPLQAELSDLVFGDEGIVPVVTEQLDIAMSSAGRGNLARSLVLDFRVTSMNIFNDLVGAVNDDVTAMERRVNRSATIFLGILGAAAIVFVAVAAHINRYVVVRLVTLNNEILRQVGGEDIEIAASGNDEITDMAESFRYYSNEVRRREAELRDLATHDELTGVNNRRHFLELAEQEIARAERMGYSLALLMIDIDRFKSINDAYGHPAGDKVIVRVAEICAAELRVVDVFGRFGGEEFIALLAETGAEQAVGVAGRLRAAVEASELSIEDTSPGLTISIGVATSPGPSHNLTELIRRSDDALYDAKERGRNQVSTASD